MIARAISTHEHGKVAQGRSRHLQRAAEVDAERQSNVTEGRESGWLRRLLGGPSQPACKSLSSPLGTPYTAATTPSSNEGVTDASHSNHSADDTARPASAARRAGAAAASPPSARCAGSPATAHCVAAPPEEDARLAGRFKPDDSFFSRYFASESVTHLARDISACFRWHGVCQ